MPLHAELADLLNAVRARTKEDTHTALPAKVLSFDPTAQTVNVQFCVKAPILDEDGAVEWEELPTLSGVPVLFPRGGGYFVAVPLVPGDFVWIMFSELPDRQWRETGEVPSEGVEAKRHGIGSAWAMPGCFPSAAPLSGPSSTELTLGKEGGPGIQVSATRVNLGSSEGSFVALASAVDSNLASLKSMIHSVNAGLNVPITTPPFNPPVALPSVAATEVKAK